MSVADKLLQVNQVKQDIKVAIENKGVDMTGIDFGGYAGKIDEIQTGGGGGGITYEDYTRTFYLALGKSTLFSNAWEHSLTVNTVNKANYPNGEIDGVIIPNSVTSIGEWAFRAWSSNNQPLVIPNSVTSIGDQAFYYWTSNNQPLVIPNSVTSIGDGAFSQWTSNTHPLVIPNSVTSIKASAFYYWTSNNQPLVIPNGVTSIGNSAFSNWSLVPYVEMKRTTPPTLSNKSAFDYQGIAPIYVPDASVTAYKTATNWTALASRIFSINDK